MLEAKTKTMEDYPVVLTADDIAEIMQVSKGKAYDLMKWKGFPLIQLGRNKRVARDSFFHWLEKYQSDEVG